ncbi:hypothetical protein D9M69_510090 [compost metagenome]
MSLLATTAPSGCAPLVTCLAMFMMSGVTPKASAPVSAPQRPNPVITSSKISRMLLAVQMSRRRFR